MESKETKSALKNARDSIRNKEYKEALKYCKVVLQSNKDNYNALVFVGVAAEGLDQHEQAVAAYKRAIDVKPDQQLAWQGLCSFYEKHERIEYREHQAAVYEKLLQFSEIEKDKRLGIIRKLAQLYCLLDDTSKAVWTYQQLVSIYDDCQKGGSFYSEKLLAHQDMVKILLEKKSLDQEWTDLLMTSITLLLYESNKDDVFHEKICKRYLTELSRRNQQNDVIIHCERLISAFPSMTYPCVLLCEMYLNPGINTDNIASIEDICQQLAELHSEGTSIVSLVRGTICLEKGLFIEARELLLKGLQGRDKIQWAWLNLVRTQVALHCYRGCDESIEKAFGTLVHMADDCKESILIHQMISRLERASPNDLLRVQETLSNLASSDIPVVPYLRAKLHLEKRNWTEFDEIISKIQPNADIDALIGWSLYLKDDVEASQIQLKKVIESGSQKAIHYYWLGVVQSNAQAQDSFRNLVTSAKLDPFYAPTFLQLGHYYVKISDERKASSCYQKAFSLNPDSDEIGTVLVDILNNTGQEDIAFNTLVNVTTQASAGSAKWAWLRLGLHQLKHQEHTDAIKSLQSALRVDPSDVNCWESLADAYMQRGSYTAALKAFKKAAQLNPDMLYCFYQMATIKHHIGLLSEAILEFKDILEKSPDYVPALKGLGETLIALAQSSLTQFLDKRAVLQCQEAIVYLTRAAAFRPDLTCIWKLLGDACAMLHPVSRDVCWITVPEKLKSGKSIDSRLCKIEILALGSRCYAKAIQLLPESSSLWHDLGVSYSHQAMYVDCDTLATELSSKAFNAMKKAVSLDPNNYQHWSTLGTIAATKYINNRSLAQHCLIKSIQLDSNNASAWTNLGVLYLENDNIELAHLAFKTAQSLDPSCVECWIGQALIAETVEHEDAMDLFRHATELANNTEGALGYGHWVCKILQDTTNRKTDLYNYSIVHMNAIIRASDEMDKYTQWTNDNSAAYMILSMLLERQGLLNKAVVAMENGLRVLEQNSNQSDEVYTSYIGLLCKAGKYDAAIVQYEKLPSGSEYNGLSDHLALCLYKTNEFSKSYTAYEQALQETKDDGERAHIFAALGIVAYKLNDNELSKTNFFKCFQSKPPSPQGIFALCALGLLQSDIVLASAAICEVESNATDVTLVELCELKTFVSLFQDGFDASRQVIDQFIQKHPDDKGIGRLAVKFPLQMIESKSVYEATMLCRQLLLMSNSREYHPQTSLLNYLVCLGGGLHSKQNQLSMAQKALFADPSNQMARSILMSAIFSERLLEGDADKLVWFIKLVQNILDGTNDRVRMWLLHILLVSYWASNKLDDARKIIKQAMEICKVPGTASLQLKAYEVLLNGNLDELHEAIETNPSSLFYHGMILVNYYKKNREFNKAEDILAILSTLHSSQLMLAMEKFEEAKVLLDSYKEAYNYRVRRMLQSYTEDKLGNMKLSKRYWKKMQEEETLDEL